LDGGRIGIGTRRRRRRRSIWSFLPSFWLFWLPPFTHNLPPSSHPPPINSTFFTHPETPLGPLNKGKIKMNDSGRRKERRGALVWDGQKGCRHGRNNPPPPMDNPNLHKSLKNAKEEEWSASLPPPPPFVGMNGRPRQLLLLGLGASSPSCPI
jgi:hypothetical protein